MESEHKFGKAWRNHIIRECILGIFYLGQYEDFKTFRDKWNERQNRHGVEQE